MTKALILAGGLGTRLRPLTYSRPKHLLPIANRPHVWHVLDLLQRHGIGEVVLLTSYLTEAFASTRAEAEARGMTVRLTHEPEPLGTAGALKNAQSLVGDDTFLAFNGDVLTDCDLGGLLRFHRSKNAVGTILLTPVEDPSIYGVVTTDGSGEVTGFVEKPPHDEAPTDLINAGVYVFEPEVLERIPEGVVVSSERELFPDLVATRAGLHAMATDAYWMDIGTPEKYLAANLDALAGRFKTTAAAAVDDRGVLVADDAEVATTAEVSSSCLGSKSRLSENCLVRDSVLLPGVVVEEGARVVGTILGEDVRVAAGAALAGETIADGSLVGGT
ncbi:MAG: sugar phosphate nucleotidyltransferase [Actinomycetota bacterium]